MKKCLFGLLLISAVIFAETVGEVRVSSTTKAMNPEALESLVANCVSTKVGDTLSAKSLSEDIRKLVLSGKVDDVRTDISKNADGQTVLTYIITPKPIISAIVFTGNTQYKEKKLRNNLKVAVGEQVDESAIAESRKEMLKRYTDDGFYGTEIKTVRTLDEDGNVRLTFAIKEPTHCKLHKVYFENNTVFDTDELRTAIVTQRQWWRYIFRMGNYFNPDQLPLDKEKLRQLYGKKGYMDFTVKEIRQEKIEEDTWIDVTFVLDEGQPYTVGKMSVTGNTLFASSLLLSKTLTKTGDVHDTERELLDIDMIRAGYDELGYIDLKIYPYYLKNSEKHVVDVEFRIMEGKPASVRNIDITGNTITKDEVIRRELAIATYSVRHPQHS